MVFSLRESLLHLEDMSFQLHVQADAAGYIDIKFIVRGAALQTTFVLSFANKSLGPLLTLRETRC